MNWRSIASTLAALIIFGSVALAQKEATLFVTVVAPSTGPLVELKAKDFIVQGGKAEVSDAVLATEPLSIELLVDISRPQVGINPPIQEMRTGFQAFVRTIRGREPRARIGLIEVGGAAVPVVDLGAPPATLDKAVDSLAPGADMGGAVIVEAVQDASHKLADEPAPRRAVVSVDFASPDSFPDPRVDGLAKDVFKSGVSVWAVTVRPTSEQTATNGSASMLYSSREHAFNSIIKNNSGLRDSIVSAVGLKDQLQMIANSLLSQYALTMKGVDAAHARDLKISTSSGAKVLASVFVR